MSSSSSPSHLWSNECLSRGLPWSDDTEDAVGESVSYSEGDLRRCDQRLSQPASHKLLNHSPNQSSTSTLPCLFIAPPHRHQLAPPWTMRRIWLTRVASGQLLPYAIPKLTSAGYKLVAGMSLHVPPPPPPLGSGRISVRVRRRTRYLGRYLDLLISSSGGRGGPWTMKGSDNHDPPICEYTPRTRTLVLLLGRCSHDSNDSSNASSYCTTIS